MMYCAILRYNICGVNKMQCLHATAYIHSYKKSDMIYNVNIITSKYNKDVKIHALRYSMCNTCIILYAKKMYTLLYV